jgi:hypothetical protein
MRRTATALLAIAAIAGASPALAAETRYGSGVGKADAVKISELLGHPEKYVGKTVRVEGIVTAVCAKRGCWMELASDKEFQSIKVKVDDGVMVFPMEAKGKVAAAEGVFTRIDVPADPKSGSGPEIVYRIQGTGAVVR